MQVILAAKSSLLANVHGSLVFGANPVQDCTTPKKKIKNHQETENADQNSTKRKMRTIRSVFEP